MEGRGVLAPETGKARLLTVYRRTGGTAWRWEAEDRNRCLDVMDSCGCSWAMTRMSCCYRPTSYKRNHRRTGPIQNDLTRKQNYNSKTVDDLTIALFTIETWLEEKLTWTFKRKNNILRSDWKFQRVVEKFEVGIEKNKLRRRKISKWVEKVRRDRRLALVERFCVFFAFGFVFDCKAVLLPTINWRVDI